MNFLGIGPGEIFLILILLMVVVGPERLPEFARGAGRLVIRVRNWVARSPDAQMVLRAREELELELDELRKSLTEDVETVRKELEAVRGDLAEATRLAEESAEEVARTRIDLDEIADLNGVPDDAAQTIAPSDLTASSAESIPADVADFEVDPGPIGSRQRAVAEREAAEALAAQESPANGQPVPRSFKPGHEPTLQMPEASSALAAPDDTALDELSRRIESLSATFGQQLQSLTDELTLLRERQAQAVAPAPPADQTPTESTVALVPVGLAPAEPVATRRHCKGLTRSGEPCGAAPLKGQEYCRAHAGQQVLEEVAS